MHVWNVYRGWCILGDTLLVGGLEMMVFGPGMAFALMLGGICFDRPVVCVRGEFDKHSLSQASEVSRDLNCMSLSRLVFTWRGHLFWNASQQINTTLTLFYCINHPKVLVKKHLQFSQIITILPQLEVGPRTLKYCSWCILVDSGGRVFISFLFHSSCDFVLYVKIPLMFI